MRPFIIASMLWIIPFLATPAFSQMGPMAHTPANYKSALGLSDEQWAKLKPLQLEYKKTTIRQAAKIRIAEVELYDMTDHRDFDMDKATAKIKEIEDLKAQLAITRYEMLRKTGAIVTDAQFEKLLQMIPAAGGPDALHHPGPMMEKKGMMGGPMTPTAPTKP